VKDYIANGETYQVNYTMRLEGGFRGDARLLFTDLVRSQDGRYAAFIRASSLAICSGSPELFFHREGRLLTTRPMKGTARRGLTLADDRAQRDRLLASPKERAENVMIAPGDAGAEYDECLLKAAVLVRPPPSFELLETMRWTPDEGFFLLDRHLRRLLDSAEYFGIPCKADALRQALSDALAGAARPLRVRLLVGPDGAIAVQQSPLERSAQPARVALAADAIDRLEVFLYHKTTNRRVYEQAGRPGVDDVLLWNEDGELTETTIANVVIELDGKRVTPPVHCGLLPGTFRAHLLEAGAIRERVVTLSDLERATRLWMINSVQEWRATTLAG
jgi:para-aminobenzoate synthetase/4-amino-4-deoxychorismate lyase